MGLKLWTDLITPQSHVDMIHCAMSLIVIITGPSMLSGHDPRPGQG